MHSDSFPPISSCTRRLRRPPCAPPRRARPPSQAPETCTGLRLFPPHPISPPPRRRPPRLRLGAMRPPAPPCRSGWRRGPGCAAPSGPPCDVQAYRTAWSAPGRLQAPVLRASAVCCFRSFRWYLSYCVVAAAGGGPLATGPSTRDCGWAAGADGMGGRRRHPAVSDPAVPPLRLRPAGPLV